ncbi:MULTISPECIES: amino acid ABC transporter ATP-binding protein [unclassified Mycolicibacterium]|uniref:amino acid ABC transporter ATP-binding protein n=1 Tax=unclassified Mycolicibacterium TaxID=2636767 RepID=UPI002ED7F304
MTATVTHCSLAIEAIGVRKSFGQHEVLKGVDLTVKPGEVVAILGPSGSGKSTLLRTLNHLERIDAGLIRMDGEIIGYRRKGQHLHELSSRDVRRQRARIGFVFQNFNLFPHLTVLENVIEAPTSAQRRDRKEVTAEALTLLERVGVGDKAHEYPRRLSGGQQQRVAIARALALHPKMILFDEPTSALDPELVGEVLDVIRQLAQAGSTLVIVTHEVTFAREVADRIVFMDDGLVIEEGTPTQMLDNTTHPRTKDFLSHVL